DSADVATTAICRSSLARLAGFTGGYRLRWGGTGNSGVAHFTVPVALPAERHGLTPELALAYSTGTGNGPFGMGWQLSLPGVSRRTSRGIPRYVDDTDLSGAEDLVRVAGSYPGRVRYRPRTEGLFSRIEHVRDASGDYWGGPREER